MVNQHNFLLIFQPCSTNVTTNQPTKLFSLSACLRINQQDVLESNQLRNLLEILRCSLPNNLSIHLANSRTDIQVCSLPEHHEKVLPFNQLEYHQVILVDSHHMFPHLNRRSVHMDVLRSSQIRNKPHNRLLNLVIFKPFNRFPIPLSNHRSNHS